MAKAFGLWGALRNLRDPREMNDMRVDIALQGAKITRHPPRLDADPQIRRRIMALKRTELCESVVVDLT